VTREAYLKENLLDKKFRTDYLRFSLQDHESLEEFAIALKHVVEAMGGVTKISKAAGIDRSHLHRLLRGENFPQLNTFLDICGALDIDILGLEGSKEAA